MSSHYCFPLPLIFSKLQVLQRLFADLDFRWLISKDKFGIIKQWQWRHVVSPPELMWHLPA
jgi:hypothetical protein